MIEKIIELALKYKTMRERIDRATMNRCAIKPKQFDSMLRVEMELFRALDALPKQRQIASWRDDNHL